MEKIGIFYGSQTAKTAVVAQKIINAFQGSDIEIVPIETAEKSDFERFNNLIAGAATWFDGELPTYWDELMPELATINLNNKRVAIFGLGDQINYPDNFADGVGILADLFMACGANITGFTSSEGYAFERSRALKDEQLRGLVIDVENQNEKTDERINEWVKQLKKAFR